MALQGSFDHKSFAEALKPFMKEACDESVQPVDERLTSIGKTIAGLAMRVELLEKLSTRVEELEKLSNFLIFRVSMARKKR